MPSLKAQKRVGKMIKNLDDKDLVIICVTWIASCAMFALQDPIVIVSNCVSGLLGVAVGKAGNDRNNRI